MKLILEIKQNTLYIVATNASIIVGHGIAFNENAPEIFVSTCCSRIKWRFSHRECAVVSDDFQPA
jgi:hypothetical protein